MKPKRAFFAVLTLLLAAAVVSPIASGQTTCDDPIVDEANVFKSDVARVEAAARDLVQRGGDVRLRTIQSLGSFGNLDNLVAQLEKACISWRGPEGTRKNNLIVLVISLQEKKTGLYFGSQWEKTLSDKWIGIQTDIMNPRFRDGDFAGGFVKGLQEIERLVSGQAGAREPVARRAGSSGLWKVLVALVAASLAAVGGVALYRGVAARRARVQKRLAAQQRARLARQGAASKVNELVEAVGILEIKVKELATRISQDDAQRLLESLSEAKRLTDTAAEAYSNTRRSGGDPDSPHLSEAEYRATEEEYEKILLVLQEAGTAIDGVGNQVEVLQRLMVEIPTKLEQSRESMEQVANRLLALQKEGYRTDHLAALLASAGISVDKAADFFKNNQLGQSAKYLKEAQELAGQAATAAEGLPNQRREVETAAAGLGQRIKQVGAAIAACRQSFERIIAGYPEPCWEPIRGNGTEAEKRIDWALESLDTARSAASMDRQEWQRAEELLKEAHNWLDEADSFMRSIDALESNLTEAKRDAPVEIAAAEADITKAWEYIGRHDEDIRESLEEDLRLAQEKLKTAKDELLSGIPDYLKALRLAKEANGSADRILEEARGEHEAAERLRARASGALRDGRAAVSKAKEYMEDHHVAVQNEARSRLREALAHLHEADTTTDLHVRISYAQQAESQAEQAYTRARENVRQAEEARRRRYAATMGGIVLGQPGPSSGGRTGSSGWGSRSGGGSTSWGGGRGGGGSTGW